MSSQPQSAAAKAADARAKKANADAEAKRAADAEAERAADAERAKADAETQMAADAETQDDAGAGDESRPGGEPGTTREPDAPKPGTDAPPPGDAGGHPATGVAAATAATEQPATLEDAVQRHLERHPACPRWIAVDVCRQAFPELAGLPPTRISRQRSKAGHRV